MLYAAPFARVMQIVTHGTRTERTNFALLKASEQQYFSHSFDAVSQVAYGSSAAVKSYMSLASIVRMLWRSMPNEVFTSPSPNFRILAQRTIQNMGLTDYPNDLPGNIATILKRIRSFHLTGRRTTSFNADSREHTDLLESQSWRCGLCLYKFESELNLYAVEDDEVVIDRTVPVVDEIRLDPTYRRPELDHIIPHLLGGDGLDNWQVLCRSCNQGKSDAITGLARHFQFASFRTSDFVDFRAGKRYAVLAEYWSSGPVIDTTELAADKYLRIFRRHNQGMYNLENLEARIS
jgi:hypothetical protein